ncbi:MAG: hypothetical protein HOP12_02540 [Candidatus Eisenbacteria bacterium]|uniref:DUF3570 domain-containing protein n=1 Tax=Eiseniibacteriota bacterium TaxID=2212470 RepID=A0A849SJJ5_UNCEI|nr:hypothetical protein [Candidatus Eisenbacteria bacterium]
MQSNWVLALRYVDTELERPRWRTTANYRVIPTLQLGLEYNPVAGEVGALATWFVLTETERRPALFLGTSSDRIGSPKGTQSYYLTAAKYLPLVHTSPYVSLNYSEWDNGWNVPIGANVELGGGVSVQPMYDGHRTHLLATYATNRLSFTLIWAWLERAGVAMSFGF